MDRRSITTLPGIIRSPVPVLESRPSIRTVLARTMVSLLVAVVAPALLFSLVMLALDVYAAVIVALLWTISAMCWRRATKRPLSGLLLLTAGIMTVRTVFMLATGNTFVYFIQPVFTDAAVAAIFLGSLWTARPCVARLAPDFYPMNAEIAGRPRIRQLFRKLTLMWGLVVVVKASVTLWLLMSQSLINFVLIKNATVTGLTVLAVAATIVMAAIVVRQEGLLPAG